MIAENDENFVWGSLPRILELQVKVSLKEAFFIAEDLMCVVNRLFTMCISFALSQAGYYVEEFAGDDFYEGAGERFYTTNFKEEDWIRLSESFAPWERPSSFGEPFSWNVQYHNDELSRNVIFVNEPVASFTIEGQYVRAEEVIFEEFKENVENYIIVSPSLKRSIFEEYREKYGEDCVFTISGFFHKFLPDLTIREDVKRRWIYLRDKIFQDLLKKWPIIIFALEDERISRIPEWLRKAKKQLENRDWEEAVGNVGKVCEVILEVMHSVELGKEKARPQGLGALVDTLREPITRNFGEDILNNLDTIRELRNLAVHAKEIELDEIKATKAVMSTETFYELFKRLYFKEKRH